MRYFLPDGVRFVVTKAGAVTVDGVDLKALAYKLREDIDEAAEVTVTFCPRSIIIEEPQPTATEPSPR